MKATAVQPPNEPVREAWEGWLARWFWPLAALGIAVNLSGLHLTILEPDAALYATVARHMAESGNFQELIARGADWLDKPHFPFWVTAVSFRLFGVGTVAYKLPGLLFWALGVVYTWRYALLLYSRTVARLAVLLLLTAQHLILSNADVRAEPFLVGLLIASLFHFVRAQGAPGLSLDLVWGALFAACAVMTKGPFLILPLLGALLGHALLRRDPRALLAGRWVLAVALVLLFISPELIALYRQFDLHPEKSVFGRTGVSGVRFFFWDSQFGRFFNSGPIRGRGDPFFFLHTVLWTFLPWSLWLCVAVFRRLRRTPLPEAYSYGAAGLTFLVFSLSRFQLPHYLNILFPLFAVITASWAVELPSDRPRWPVSAQRAVAIVLWGGAAALPVLIRPPGWAVAAALAVVGAAGAWALFRRRAPQDVLGFSFTAAVALNLIANTLVFPALQRHQGGSEAAALLNTLPPRPTMMFGVTSYAFQFYARPPVQQRDVHTVARAAHEGPVYVYLPEGDARFLDEAGLQVRALERFGSYPLTRLSLRFLNPATREGVLQPFLLAEVTASGAPTGR